MVFDVTTQKNVDRWLNDNYDEETKATIRKLLVEDPQAIINAFYTNLSFGTGGLRGLMGVGTNRINRYTIMSATQGLANYINKQPSPPHGHAVYIGYDSRNNSRNFAEEAARVLAANQIKVYLSKELRPTPLISFGCRLKECTAAIIVTASHNPPEYNGYKVYWSDGGQVLPPHDKGIINEVNAITELHQIKQIPSLQYPLIEEVSQDVDNAYLEATYFLQHYSEQNKQFGKKLKIVYANLHGTGITLMPHILSQWGFSDLTLVEQQKEPDGNFPTVSSPNPEDKEALELGIKALEQIQGDLLIATDPDADRLAVAVRHQNHVHLLNGNQIACLCLQHICEARTKNNTLPANAIFAKTIGTTELFKAIADAYERPCFDVLTGFKYIAGKIKEWEEGHNGPQFLFGGEESFGYLLGTHARDKDAIISGALVCEVALQAKLQNKTLVDLLHEIYRKYGVYTEKLLSIKFEESKAGKEQMVQGMARLRKNPPKTIAGINVTALEDYQYSLRTEISTGKSKKLTLPVSDVLLFWLEDGSKIMVRPSGTEPKIKLYCGVINKRLAMEAATQECEGRATSIVNSVSEFLN